MIVRTLLARLAVCLLVCTPWAASAWAADARAPVTDLTFVERSDGRGYVIRVRAPEGIPAYNAPTHDGRTLRWTLYGSRRAASFEPPAPEGPVADYTLREQGGHLLLTFTLKPDARVRASAYRDGASSDVLLNLTTSGRAAPVADRSPDPSPPSTADGPSSTGAARWALDTIVIDAGHGGKDPGAQAHGLQEKDIVLDIALKAGEYIENRLGINVVYTRTTDRFIPLKKRGKIANEAEAKLFVSIHVNAAGAVSAHGTETFFLGQHKSEAARKVMKRENSVIKYEDNQSAYDTFDSQALVRYTLTQSAYMRQSQKLAKIIEDQFANRVNRHSRGVKQAGFYVLWSASMPAVLVETGFVTNPSDARFLGSEMGRDYIASAIFRAVRAYRDQYERGIKSAAR
ncbi:N-acetylmuramoyl-L-alanine amidase family protein [Salisaeta longa]|uniref:N-acetylmuramoyl-L-alanine amidase family protein n=1 Tax=Salisaeta longa TaxID=503170 RepID=UPI0003B46EC2|nr:N-acetylmuramoyl-L-alanine amidase [Salisaeta longa]